MLFPTVLFAIFFPIVLTLSWALNARPRLWKPFIVIASYVFYGAASWYFCLLLAAVTLGNQLCAVVISRARGERKRPSAGWASLTPTEERVVALAAEGLTNSQIAERLFVAPGTIKVHLGHIFTKLGVATRAELAGAATRRSIERSHR